ncbi:3-methyladenine DNA glycosylase [hydrothermal vent metagenome]|uniref:3-methyladenine DNA glycosylase n=1 Tax=hydrothermal vent metagenome TaxID=652676 RepID=A0A3B0XLZ2_9ZZZZ
MQLKTRFFNRDAALLAKDLLGKVIRHKHQGRWLAARIIETEAYYMSEKGSHASLGYTDKRRALFMPAGSIYMYYARGKDSLNISCKGKGNAVLIKSAFAFEDANTHPKMPEIMQRLNPAASGGIRPTEKLCAGQTLLCRSLGIKLTDWDQQPFSSHQFFIDDIHYTPKQIIQTTRLGIPKGRDEHLMLRYIDFDYAKYCTKNPLTQRKTHYRLLHATDASE